MHPEQCERLAPIYTILTSQTGTLLPLRVSSAKDHALAAAPDGCDAVVYSGQ